MSLKSPMAQLIVKAEQERLWLAIDRARKQLSAERVDPAVQALWASIGPARIDIPAALAIVLVASANFAADALTSIEAGEPIANPSRDDRVGAIALYFKQLLEATVNDRRARALLAKLTPGHHA